MVEEPIPQTLSRHHEADSIDLNPNILKSWRMDRCLSHRVHPRSLAYMVGKNACETDQTMGMSDGTMLENWRIYKSEYQKLGASGREV